MVYVDRIWESTTQGSKKMRRPKEARGKELNKILMKRQTCWSRRSLRKVERNRIGLYKQQRHSFKLTLNPVV